MNPAAIVTTYVEIVPLSSLTNNRNGEGQRMIGSFMAWFIFLVIINFGAKIVKLFKSSNN